MSGNGENPLSLEMPSISVNSLSVLNVVVSSNDAVKPTRWIGPHAVHRTH